MYENAEIEKCVECGDEMDILMHNYGTPEMPCCIHCYTLAQEEFNNNHIKSETMSKTVNKSVIILLITGFLFMAFKPVEINNDDLHLAKATEVRGKPVFVNCAPVHAYDIAFEIKIKVGGFSCPSVLDVANALVKSADKEGLPYDAIIMGSGKTDLAIKFK